ncbi:MAG: cytochrome ubiquinol oxidase subunit I, partial [Bacteroidales bacterium]
KVGDNYNAEMHLRVLNQNYANFGYGFITEESQLVPNVPLTFYAFRFMVIVGTFFLFLFGLMWYLGYKKKPYEDYKYLNWLCIAGIPLAYAVSQSGWIVSEMGRQPWVIQDLMPTYAAISSLQSNTVITTFTMFAVLFTVLLIAEMKIMLKQIKKGF